MKKFARKLCVKEAEELEGKPRLCGLYFPLALQTRLWHNGTYGKIDVRAKLPKGIGVWPAIWNVGKNIG